MFGDGSLTFREFAMREPVPLAVIQGAVLKFLKGRDDAVLFGAQAVHAYVDEPRMTQDVDTASTRAAELADELRAYLDEQFHIAVRVRGVRGGIGHRIHQMRKRENRHLVDVRPVDALPLSQRAEGVSVASPPELIANKVISMVARQKKRKGFMDAADLRIPLLTFPELKTESGAVADRLQVAGATDEAMAAWRDLVHQEILPDEDDGY